MSRTSINGRRLNGRDLALTVAIEPRDVAASVRAVLAETLYLLPPWLRSLRVQFESSDPMNANASVSVQHEYRRATITIYGGWLDGDDHRRRADILHEFMHIWTAPLADGARGVIQELFPDDGGPVRKLAEKLLVDSVETITEDLAHLCDQVIESGTPRVPISKAPAA